MSVMSIRIPDETRRKLKAIATLEGKTMSALIGKLIDDYVAVASKRLGYENELSEIMGASEPSFSGWDNDEDEIYNDL